MIKTNLRKLKKEILKGNYFNNLNKIGLEFFSPALIELETAIDFFYGIRVGIFKNTPLETVAKMVSNLWRYYEGVMDSLYLLGDNVWDACQADIQDAIFWVRHDLNWFVTHCDIAEYLLPADAVEEILSWKF